MPCTIRAQPVFDVDQYVLERQLRNEEIRLESLALLAARNISRDAAQLRANELISDGRINYDRVSQSDIDPVWGFFAPRSNRPSTRRRPRAASRCGNMFLVIYVGSADRPPDEVSLWNNCGPGGGTPGVYGYYIPANSSI